MDGRQKSFPSNKQDLLFEGKRLVCQGFPGITGSTLVSTAEISLADYPRSYKKI
jgi:hypothetical protein